MKTLRKTNDRRVTRSVTLSNGRGNSLPIPIELIIMIFSRLPLKSIARCRCVAKLWASILRRSDFTELFFSMSCSSSPKLLFAYQRQGELFFFSSPQPQNPDENSSPVVSNYQMKFSFHGDCESSDLVHGLICLDDMMIVNARVKILLKICNPSTGQVLVLPNVKSNRNRVWSLLGYDPIGKQFKILSMVQPGRDDVLCEKYQVLSLVTGNMSWRMIECSKPHHSPVKKICINGFLYYKSVDSSTKTCILVCFDVRLEKFSFIRTIRFPTRALLDETIKLINYSGKLGLLLCEKDIRFVLFDGRSKRFKLWVLEDLEKQEWSEQTFVFSTVPKNIVGRVILNFVGLTKQNEIVLSSSSNPFYLVYMNLEKKTIVRVKTQGFDVSNCGTHHIFLDHVEDVKLYGTV